jgi:hypothetical protein
MASFGAVDGRMHGANRIMNSRRSAQQIRPNTGEKPADGCKEAWALD